MRILVHIHTWNDAGIVMTALDAVARQTRPVEGVLVVDNGSTDGTAELAFPASVTVIRHPANLGTSGAVKTGIEYALASGYDWLWVLDADSVPRPDALELLVRLVEEDGKNLGAVCASHNLLALGQMLRGRILTPGGPRLPPPPDDRKTVACDSIIWSGALINLAVIGKVGLPRAGKTGCWEDLALDYGDIEYAYRIDRAGYRIVVHCDSIIDHPIGRGLHRRILGWDLYSTNHPAFRRYLYFRNLVFFWLRLYHRRNWPLLLIWFGYRFGAILTGIMLLERQRRTKIKACLWGIRDGLLGRLDQNFQGAFPANSRKAGSVENR
jgi:rhamnopyranosyl-N-acetylglucosaminyl-diphospho-decaprenol beta-1,3/1,4-galactofuranosyltransferase